MKRFAAIVLCAILIAIGLPGCGGAEAQSVTKSAPAIGGAADGYSKASSAVRDVSGASGGQRGYVNVASIIRTITGKLEIAFEWVGLCILNNRSDAGENVCYYNQVIVEGDGPSWAGVDEVTDSEGHHGAMVGREIDIFATGPDNGSRIGLDIVSGDGRYVRGLGRSEQADATYAIRIGQTAGHSWSTWLGGILLQGNFRDSPIKLLSPDGSSVLFEVKPNGDIYRRGQLLP